MPDNFVQDLYNTQNFNRYSQVPNNPLKYSDPSGEFVKTGTSYLLSVSAVTVASVLGTWGQQIKDAQIDRWLNTNFRKPK